MKTKHDEASGDRHMAPDGRYVKGRAPDESVHSYRSRLAIAAGKEPPEAPPAPKRAWLTQTEWRARDQELRRKEGMA